LKWETFKDLRNIENGSKTVRYLNGHQKAQFLHQLKVDHCFHITEDTNSYPKKSNKPVFQSTDNEALLVGGLSHSSQLGYSVNTTKCFEKLLILTDMKQIGGLSCLFCAISTDMATSVANQNGQFRVSSTETYIFDSPLIVRVLLRFGKLRR
jgi:hypothetical protein